jgi:hypothetical protein
LEDRKFEVVCGRGSGVVYKEVMTLSVWGSFIDKEP